jgi:hypothetical protein
MMETLTAVRSSKMNGMWKFTCPLHGVIPYILREPSNETLAIKTLKEHMDSRHPGVKVRLLIKSDYITHTTYSATAIVETGDLL